MSSVPAIALNSGKSIPVLGLGTWQSKPGEVKAAVEHAIDCGYRHIDCAAAYGNEKEVGDALAVKIKAGIVKREDLFITSKLLDTCHEPCNVKPAMMDSLKNLQLEYLDLYLVHRPLGYQHGSDLSPKDQVGNPMHSDDDYVDTWKEMEKLQKEGLTKSIGVSNFNQYQIERLLKNCSIQPCNNQVESHPFLLNEDMLKFCKSKNISFTAYSPFGSPDRPWVKDGDPKPLQDPTIVEIANRLGKTTGQVLIRFQIQRGAIVVAKSVTPSRIASNFDAFGFELSESDMAAISGFHKEFRSFLFEWDSDHKYYPFRENYSE